MRKTFPFFVIVLFAMFSVVLAQTPAPQNTYNVSIDTLLIDQSAGIPLAQFAATITGTNGEGIVNLVASNFSIQQQGSPSITPMMESFENSQVGVSIVLCLDASGSMNGEPLQQMKDAVCSYIDTMRPQDFVSVITFAGDCIVEAPFTNDKNYLKQTVQGIRGGRSYSSLFYAVCQSIDQLQQRGNTLERRFVVVISDGKNESLSDAYDINDCIDNANTDNVIISTIGFTNQNAQYLQNLEAMADGTDGTYNYGADDASTLNQQLGESITLLKSQYLMQFAVPAGRPSDVYSLVVTSNNFAGNAAIDLSSIMSSFPCTICNKLYNTAAERQTCIESHSNSCPHCGEEFSDISALEVHIQSQHNWECQYCDLVFASEALLDDHVSSVHKMCPVCEESFDSDAELEAHILEMEHYKCPNCDSLFVSQQLLDQHLETCSSGLPWILIGGGILVLGGIIAAVIMMKKKSAAKMEAIQTEMREREEELKRKNRKLEQKAEAAMAKPATKPAQSSSPAQDPMQTQQGSANNYGAPTQVRSSSRQAAPAKRKTMIGGSIATSYKQGMLVCTAGSNRGQSFNVTKPQVTIGRAVGNEIVINDGGVSRGHAILKSAAGMFQLTDNNSGNGTYVNGKRIKETLLKNGDVIRFGPNVEFKFEGK